MEINSNPTKKYKVAFEFFEVRAGQLVLNKNDVPLLMKWFKIGNPDPARRLCAPPSRFKVGAGRKSEKATPPPTKVQAKCVKINLARKGGGGAKTR